MLRLVLPILLGVSFGCPQDPVQEKAESWLLKVAGQTIPETDVVLHWAQRQVFQIQDPIVRLKVAKALTQQQGEELAFVNKARAAGITVPEDEVKRAARKRAADFQKPNFAKLLNQEKWTFASFENQLKNRLLVKHYFQAETEKFPPISEAQIRQYYEEKISSAMKEEEVRVGHLLLDTQEEADYVRQQLVGRSAMPFEVAARRFSKSPEADRGGVLEWFGKGAMPKVFDVCFQLKEKEISGVVGSEYGFHLFKLLERRQGRPPSLDDKKGLIEKVLRQAQEEKLIAASKEALAENQQIAIHHENLEKRLLELSAQVVVIPDETSDGTKDQPHAH